MKNNHKGNAVLVMVFIITLIAGFCFAEYYYFDKKLQSQKEILENKIKQAKNEKSQLEKEIKELEDEIKNNQ